jgi:hypothetical protein
MQAFNWDKYLNEGSEFVYRIEAIKAMSVDEYVTERIMVLADDLLIATLGYVSFLDEQLPQAKLYYTELYKVALAEEKDLREELYAIPSHSALKGEVHLLVESQLLFVLFRSDTRQTSCCSLKNLRI